MSEHGVASLKREYQTLIDAGVGDTHEWLETEDDILAKVPLLPRENIKVRFNPLLPILVPKLDPIHEWSRTHSR